MSELVARIKAALIPAIKELGYDGALTDATAGRVARMWVECMAKREPKLDVALFEAPKDSVIVTIGPIQFSSWCEHHMLPFYGEAWVAYRPGESIIGLSKVARMVEELAKGLHTQEELTATIGRSFMNAVEAVGVAVHVNATHTCMSCRGVESRNAATHTDWSQGLSDSDLVSFISFVRS